MRTFWTGSFIWHWKMYASQGVSSNVPDIEDIDHRRLEGVRCIAMCNDWNIIDPIWSNSSWRSFKSANGSDSVPSRGPKWTCIGHQALTTSHRWPSAPKVFGLSSKSWPSFTSSAWTRVLSSVTRNEAMKPSRPWLSAVPNLITIYKLLPFQSDWYLSSLSHT